MAEKNIKSRVVLKHDIESNWQQAKGFSPLKGEIIIYDPDETCSYSRIKIGNGEDNVNDLPFSNDNIAANDLGVYVQDTEPVDAEDGAIWIDTANDPEYIIPHVPQVTEADNGKVLMVVNGKWQAVKLNIAVDENGILSI